ncbi:MAG: ABC transporter permease subunit [Pseudonocardiaceae bacterium]|nr:ABC transporter permease subunit [Pseudonocardiaceae bacterium]
MPGSPAATILGPTATPEQIAAVNAEYGFDDPLPVRYVEWLKGAVTGDLGNSLLTQREVLGDIAQRIPVTFQIAIMALLMALVVTIPLAVYGAANAGKRLDRALTAFSSGFMSLPSFVVAVVLVYLLAVEAGAFPVTGWVPITESLGDNLYHAFLPAVSLAVIEVGFFYRLLRGDLIATLQEDFVLTARAKGLSGRYVLFRHALRPSLFSLLTMAGLSFGRLLGGSVIVEAFFALPGLGQLAVNSVPFKDIPTIQGIVVFVAVVYVLVNTVVDLTYTLIDPRIQVR